MPVGREAASVFRDGLCRDVMLLPQPYGKNDVDDDVVQHHAIPTFFWTLQDIASKMWPKIRTRNEKTAHYCAIFLFLFK